MRSLILAVVTLPAMLAVAQDCSQFNATDTPTSSSVSGYVGHKTLSHSFGATLGGPAPTQAARPARIVRPPVHRRSR